MSTTDTINQILNRLEHLDREKGEDLGKLKKMVLSSSKDELESFLDELDLKNVFNVFKRLLNLDEKFIREDIGDIFDQMQEVLGVEEYWKRFESAIGDTLKDDDSEKMKSIQLKILLNCCKNAKVQNSLIESDLLNLVICNLGDRDEEVSKRSVQILKYLSIKVDSFIDDHLFNQTNLTQLEQIKKRNEINKFRFYEFLISLILEKEELLLNQFVQQGIKELLDLTINSEDDPLVIRNSLVVIDKLIENNRGVDYLNQFGYFTFISNKILNSQSHHFINLLMPGYIETFSKLGSTVPNLVANHQDAITRLIEFVLGDDFTSSSIQAIGLIGRLAKGKMVLNENPKFLSECLPKMGKLLDSSNECKVQVLHSLSSLFDLNDSDATVEISNLLNNWYSRLTPDRTKTTQTIFLLCKQVFPEIHLNTLNLIRILCKHMWGQSEFAQLKTFVDYLLNRNTESDYKGKEVKFKLITELATSPFTSKTFGGIVHAKIRKSYNQGAFFVEQDVTVAVKEQT